MMLGVRLGSYSHDKCNPKVHVFQLTAPHGAASMSLPLAAGVIAVGLTALTFTLSVAGRISPAIFWGTLAIALGWYAAASVVLARGGRRGWIRITSTDRGVTVIVSRAMALTEIGGGILFTAATAWLGLRTAAGDEASLRWVIAMAALLLFSSSGMVRAARSLRNPSNLRLSPTAVTFEQTVPIALAWDSIAAVGFDHRGMAFTTPTGIAHFRASDLRSDPALIADLIEYYRTHPEARPELTNHRVAQRIRFHQFNRPAPAP
jgi:hypothetical protein